MNKRAHSDEHSAACTDPAHHVHGAKAFIKAVEQACEQRGLRLTPLRAQALGLIAAETKPIKAYDLLDKMKTEKGNAAPPTVYRALDFLLEQGFIHRLASINAFVSCHHPQVEHSVPFLICDNCQNSVELEDDGVSALLEKQAKSIGFKTRAQILEVHGVCAKCAKI
jgi:Fur family transcriptional regulator, zinc uptake regulator